MVPALQAPTRVDVYLKSHFKRLSRTRIQKIMANGDIRASDKTVKPSQILLGGEHFDLWRMKPDDASHLSQLNIEVVYQDENLVVINKPSGLAIHPTARDLEKTLTHWLKINFPGEPVHPCHRLDRETSGIIICARNKKAESSLKVAFSNNKVKKTYHALVEGNLESEQNINYPLALQGSRGLVRIKMIHDESGKQAETFVKPISYDALKNETLVHAFPKTGRQHQIRAHLALIGYPIAGDKLYGMGEEFFDAYTSGDADESTLTYPFHALHAAKIEFELFDESFQFEV